MVLYICIMTMTYTQSSIDFSIPAMRALEKLPERVRAEVIYGKLYILTVPSFQHAFVISVISAELANHAMLENNLGIVFSSPVGIYLLQGKNAVIPDIVYISHKNPRLSIDDRGVFGPSDLHIEVLSPRNKKHDLIRKKRLYEEAGVLEYWIIDPITKDAQGYFLDDGKYGDPLLLNARIHIKVLDKAISF